MIATSRHEKRQKKGRQQQQQRKRNTPELDDAGTGNPRRLGNLMRGMRLASAITAASSLSLSLSLSLSQWASSNSIFIFSFEAQRQTRRDKQLAPPSEAYWQRTGRCFTCIPLGSNPDPFFEAPEWAIPASHHRWSPNSIVDCFRRGFFFFGKDNWKEGGRGG